MCDVSGTIWLTLNIRNALLQDLLKDLGVLELLLDLGNDGLRQLLLLADLHLSLISDPRVENGLSFCGEGGGLLKFVGLGLEFRGFLRS
jgi:hypothetical protein